MFYFVYLSLFGTVIGEETKINMLINISLYISAFYMLMLIIEPLIDHRMLFFPRPIRLRIFHTLFSTRISIFSIIDRRSNLSSQYRAFEEIIRLHDPPIYLRHEAKMNDIEQLRNSARETLSALLPPRDKIACSVKPIKFEYGNRHVYIYSIHDGIFDDWTVNGQRFILYLHGGGFVFGDIDTYSGYECYLSRQYHMPVIHIEYSLSPEHKLPRAYDDVLAVYLTMLKSDRYIHRRMIGMGDSSGGTIWLRLIQILVERQLPVPRALVLISPWADLILFHLALDEKAQAQCPFFSFEFVFNLRQQIFAVWTDIVNSRTESGKVMEQSNPIEHSFHGFPPLYITAGTNEIFFDDIQNLIDKIKQEGGQVTFEVGYGLMHTYAMFHLWSPEAKKSQENIHKWIEQQI